MGSVWIIMATASVKMVKSIFDKHYIYVQRCDYWTAYVEHKTNRRPQNLENYVAEHILELSE